MRVKPNSLKYMPESVSFLLANDRREEAEEISHRYGISLRKIESAVRKEEETAEHAGRLHALRTLVSRNYVVATVAFWIASFMGLMLIYGLSTWLPEVMRAAGYSVGSALSFLLLFNAGAAAGLLLMGKTADGFGTKLTCGASFLTAGVSIALLSVKLPLLLIYVVAGLAGVGTFAGMTLIVHIYRQALSHEQPGERSRLGGRDRENGGHLRTPARRVPGGSATGRTVGLLCLRLGPNGSRHTFSSPT